jgi:hypothetical protein
MVFTGVSEMYGNVLQELAKALQAYRICCERDNTEWEHKWRETIDYIISDLPSGSGIDCGTKLSEDECTATKIVLLTSFHHMNDSGYYDGWTEHKIIITPSFDGFDMRITGRDRNDIKDYLCEVYDSALSQQYIPIFE